MHCFTTSGQIFEFRKAIESTHLYMWDAGLTLCVPAPLFFFTPSVPKRILGTESGSRFLVIFWELGPKIFLCQGPNWDLDFWSIWRSWDQELTLGPNNFPVWDRAGIKIFESFRSSGPKYFLARIKKILVRNKIFGPGLVPTQKNVWSPNQFLGPDAKKSLVPAWSRNFGPQQFLWSPGVGTNEGPKKITLGALFAKRLIEVAFCSLKL